MLSIPERAPDKATNLQGSRGEDGGGNMGKHRTQSHHHEHKKQEYWSDSRCNGRNCRIFSSKCFKKVLDDEKTQLRAVLAK
jgi:hypothetical protein